MVMMITAKIAVAPMMIHTARSTSFVKWWRLRKCAHARKGFAFAFESLVLSKGKQSCNIHEGHYEGMQEHVCLVEVLLQSACLQYAKPLKRLVQKHLSQRSGRKDGEYEKL
jgi:hypothetical protein